MRPARTLRLSELGSQACFALLGPGFLPATGQDGTGTELVLVRGLRRLGLADGARAARLAFVPYESTGREAELYEGTPEPVSLERDVAPALVTPELEARGHAEAVAAIREAIAAGDVYQVNFTLRARFSVTSSSALFETLLRHGIPRFAAWVRFPDGREIVSASPELFFRVDGRAVVAEPMKGTALPDAGGVLESSGKDRAELAMITDLLRNDLTRVCVPRSVRCTTERRFVRLAYAWQAVSEVAGDLPPDVGALDVLDALHPGGSITGAPKSTAMELIERLEPGPRGAYCGALGLMVEDRAVFSLLIRTAERVADGWRYGVGGGIVWDSDAAAELAEARLKLGALGWTPTRR